MLVQGQRSLFLSNQSQFPPEVDVSKVAVLLPVESVADGERKDFQLVWSLSLIRYGTKPDLHSSEGCSTNEVCCRRLSFFCGLSCVNRKSVKSSSPVSSVARVSLLTY